MNWVPDFVDRLFDAFLRAPDGDFVVGFGCLRYGYFGRRLVLEDLMEQSTIKISHASAPVSLYDR